jgi:DNA-binding response OmpR family regulator
MTASVLLVEDDVDLREELAACLTRGGFSVVGAASVQEAERALEARFDLLVLDINLPDGSGLELCQRLRPYLSSGIVMCTGRSERELRITSLRQGADAYLVKPVDPDELLATLVSVLRRVTGSTRSSLMATAMPVPWRLDRVRQTLLTPNRSTVALSVSECLLLASLLNAPNKQRSRDDLLQAFEAARMPTDGRRLEALASRLRRKVADACRLQLPLQSVYGKGYAFHDHSSMG